MEIKGGLEQQRSKSFIRRDEKGKTTWGHAAVSQVGNQVL
jgi:hypothetical protein